MTKFFQICILLVMLFVAAGNSYGQVIYTTNGSCPPNQPNYFGVASSSCWDKSGIDCNPGVLSPPVSGTPGCPIVININHPINLGTFNFGPNVTVNVNSGGIWNITNNITQTGQADSRLVINGGQVNAGGVIMNQGIAATNTTFRIETNNSGIFDVSNEFTTANNTTVEISGDGSGIVETGSLRLVGNVNLNLNGGGKLNVLTNANVNKGAVATINLNGGELNVSGTLDIGTGSGSSLATLNITGNGNGNRVFAENLNLNNNSDLVIEANGDLIVDGPTIFASNGTKITNRGFFRTRILDIRGQGTLDNLGAGVTVIDEDLIIRGSAGLIVEGNSEIEIGGNLSIVGSGTLKINEEGSVRVCGDGNLPNVSPSLTVNFPSATYERGNCRILPVDYVYIESAYSKVSNATMLTWATSKEWENSRFEIERSVGGISDFVKVGEVQGMGWKDSITEYEYTDRNLPLIGGNIYYRLKQVDINGEYSFSKVMSVKIDGVQFTEGVWRAYPNPTDGSQFRISLLDPAQYNQEKITFRIIHPTSVSREVMVNSENEMNEALARMIGNIPKGVFVVELRWGQKIEHIKVLRKR